MPNKWCVLQWHPESCWVLSGGSCACTVIDPYPCGAGAGSLVGRRMNLVGKKIISFRISTWNLQLWMYIAKHNSIHGTCDFFTNINLWYFHNILQLHRGLKMVFVYNRASNYNSYWICQQILFFSVIGPHITSGQAHSSGNVAQSAWGKNIWEKPATKQDWLLPLSFCSLPLSVTTGHLRFKGKTWSESFSLVFWLNQHCPVQFRTLHGGVEAEL